MLLLLFEPSLIGVEPRTKTIQYHLAIRRYSKRENPRLVGSLRLDGK
jgi:hypothetical protein